MINYDEENERFSTSLTTIDGHPESLRVVLDFRKVRYWLLSFIMYPLLYSSFERWSLVGFIAGI